VTDILIRDVPEGVVQVLDANARRAKLSRAEYVRRMLERERELGPEVTVECLRQFGETFADLADPEVMKAAWR